MSSGSFDWKSLQKFLNPQAADDFSKFMDSVPIHAGKGALIAAGIAWMIVAGIGLFTMVQGQELAKIRSELQTTEALKPLVPVVSLVDVSKDELRRVADQFKQIYPTLSAVAAGDNFIIQSKNTSDFVQFREALGHLVNGGAGWRVTIDSLCIGRECKQNALSAVLKVQKLKIDKPSS